MHKFIKHIRNPILQTKLTNLCSLQHKKLSTISNVSTNTLQRALRNLTFDNVPENLRVKNSDLHNMSINLPSDIKSKICQNKYLFIENNLSTIKKITEFCSQNRIQFVLRVDPVDVDNVASLGDTKNLNWLQQYCKNNNIVMYYTTDSIDSACQKGDLCTIQWFYENSEMQRRNMYTENGVFSACSRGYYDIIKYFISMSTNNFKYNSSCVDVAYTNNHKNIIKLIMDNCNKYNLDFKYNALVDFALKENDVDMLKYIFEQNENKPRLKYSALTTDILINKLLEFPYSMWKEQKEFHTLKWLYNYCNKNNLNFKHIIKFDKSKFIL